MLRKIFLYLCFLGYVAVGSAKADPFTFGGPISALIVSATINVNLAEFSGDLTVFGTQVNLISLLVPGYAPLDLSNAFFGTAAFPATPAINMGPTQTGVVSVAIPSSFFPALATGAVGYHMLFTDTSDGIFALDYISLVINTSAGTLQSVIGSKDGFGLGIAPGGNLPAPLPLSLPFGATGTGFDESISSKALETTVIPEPSTFALVATALLAGVFSKRRWKRCVLGVLLAALFGTGNAFAQFSCPPVPQPAAVAVPGKAGETGWLIQDVEADANGNKIQLWCLKAIPGPNPPKHGGPDFAVLYKPAGAKDADAVWIGACVFPGGENKPNKDFTKTPNGQPKQFTKITQLNYEPFPNGTNDWDYSYDTATGNLSVTKTKGAYFLVVDRQTGRVVGAVYRSGATAGPDTYPAPKDFGGLKFTSGGTTEQLTLLDGAPGFIAEAVAAVATNSGNSWNYTLAVNSFGGSGTTADPYVGTLVDVVAGDTFSISGTGIFGAFVSGAASLPVYGGWEVQSSTSTSVTFVATADAEFIPGFQIPGFGFFSTSPAGTVAWNLLSSNEAIGSSGVVNGPISPPDETPFGGTIAKSDSCRAGRDHCSHSRNEFESNARNDIDVHKTCRQLHVQRRYSFSRWHHGYPYDRHQWRGANGDNRRFARHRINAGKRRRYHSEYIRPVLHEIRRHSFVKHQLVVAVSRCHPSQWENHGRST